MASSVDNQIRSLVNQANNYQSQINAHRSQYNAALARKRQYEQRLQQVQDIKRNLGYKLDGHCDGIRRKQNEALAFERAARGGRTVGSVIAEINATLEKRLAEDSRGRQMHDNLQAEISRCQREIDNAQAAMNSSKAAMDRASSQRSNCISRARTLSRSDDATIKVR